VQFDRPLDEATLQPLREALKRRGEGVPIQHLLGQVEFYRRQFKTDARALIPRPETEELAELVLALDAPRENQAILDMGCGSGVLGLTLAAERPAWQVTLADVSPDALALAAENAAALAISNVSLLESDLFSNVSRCFDGMVANLPYVPELDRPSLSKEVLHDPALALFGGPDGLEVLARFIPAAFARLNPGGWVALEIGHDQASQVVALLQQSGFSDVTVKNDLSGIPRFPIARRSL
jgi:release factor glutamine methyltransferase